MRELNRLHGTYATVRLVFAVLLILAVIAQGATYVKGDTVYNETNVTVPAYSVITRNIYLEESGGMAGWFRITSGDGIHFFIVDSVGHNEIQSTGSAATAYKAGDYARGSGGWYYWNFTAPLSDTWYVYFSNALFTAYAGIEDQLDIVINTETAPPAILAPMLQSPVSGIVTIEFTAIDDCFPVERVELYVDGVLEETVMNDNMVSGYRFESSIMWDTNLVDNGNHTVTLRAYDTFGRASDHYYLGLLEVRNDWIALEQPVLFIIMISAIVVFVSYCRNRSRR